MIFFVPPVVPTCFTVKVREAPSEEVTPSSGILQVRVRSPVSMAEPLTGGWRLRIRKSCSTVSSMKMEVAPGLLMFAARSSKRVSRSASSGVTATCEVWGSVAQLLRAEISIPSEPIRPIR